MAIRILIADDHSVVRTGPRTLLEADGEIKVVGEAGDGTETLRLAEGLHPDLVLLDITMPPRTASSPGSYSRKRIRKWSFFS